MKILGISCSPRQEGNTAKLIKIALEGAKEEGAEVELFTVSGKDIKPCDGCRSCFETGECHIKDDMQTLYEDLLEAKGIIFGTPIYAYGMASQAKILIDRTVCLNRPERNLANKIGGAIVVAGSLGLIEALKSIYFYFVTRQMIPANFVAAYPLPKVSIEEMENCMRSARNLGRQIVKIAKKDFEYPTDIPRSFIAFGTHTL